MKNARGEDARRVALRAIIAVMNHHGALTDPALFESARDDRERAFARRLANGVVRWSGALEALAGELLDRPLKPRDRDIALLLQLGIYQLWREDTPGHAAVHATAEVARSLRKAWAVGLVNAVLRRFLRERDERLAALESRDAALSHPPWLLGMLKKDWPDQWRSIVDANNEQPPMWLRTNGQRITRDTLAMQLTNAGFQATSHPEVDMALRLDPPAPVEQAPGFSEGHWSVQDAAAQLAAHYLAPRPGDRILDACAAPGGKTCHLLEREPNLQLTALDNDERRLGRVRENLARLGLEARLQVGDATDPSGWWDGEPFDRILLDAPCSAIGVIRRHPEIKWQRTPEQVGAAVALQAKMLDALWPLLRPGGILVYATCSVLKRENSQQIQRFLQDNPSASVDSDPAGDESPGRQVLTGETGMDGFYYATLRKPA
ncbi:16S rRNA (cytosine(967)-C(5))-methyltransferase RsmB [Marinihelvus fidelis]|uniref:16S rRNA (cytosine(967)-C(5))-methyltransferase n=1 Tax=Marinihelvus fidelis TaxID=2613842 RepID=A0A5N0TA43_9GAMM|nr:16S rRNA (cytosine(967)-C(5))-methyltransferase RsmB [Marinihelvus fidelis]KAA9131324.1 16S rRNA (cytosine(967)-C(5))-methyltransferase RsmB [Marinihelvus fidelis]